MFWSNYFIPTLKDTASEDAQVISNSLMLKSGMIRKNASGIYTWLPLGLRVLNKVENIVKLKFNSQTSDLKKIKKDTKKTTKTFSKSDKIKNREKKITKPRTLWTRRKKAS